MVRQKAGKSGKVGGKGKKSGNGSLFQVGFPVGRTVATATPAERS